MKKSQPDDPKNMKVMTLSETQFCQLCAQIADFYIEEGFDGLVFIESGGKHVYETMCERFREAGVRPSALGVSCTRPGSRRKRGFGRFAHAIISIIPVKILDKLRLLEYRFLVQTTDRKLIYSEAELSDFSRRVSNVLVVDDAWDSGSTMRGILAMLAARGINAKSAVVVFTRSDNTTKPDYYCINDCLIRFPWSLDA